MASGYTITRSNYSLKKFHKKTYNGTIYERDFMAPTNLGSYDSSTFPNSEHNFKIVRRSDSNNSRKHNYGEWLLNDENNPNWTKEKINISEVSDESKIRLKPNKNSILDFVYYGNCVELLKSSVNDIIEKFPGELYFTGEEILTEKSGSTEIKWYLIENSFNVDIHSSTISDENAYVYKYFCENIGQYLLYDKNDNPNRNYFDTENKLISKLNWNVIVNGSFKPCDGEYSHEITINGIKIRRYYIGGKYYYLYKDENNHNSYIRLCPTDIDEIYNEQFDDFEKILLNKDSEPLYTAELDSPYEDESGIKTMKKRYTWPTIQYKVGTKYHSYNIDVISNDFETYFNNLLDLCDFYDNHYTDNIWKNLTHSSIKEIDETYIKEGFEDDEYTLSLSKLHGFLNAAGRQFDELKRYINNIKYVNNITYNGNNNLPDYFLTDTLNLEGWEVSSISRTLDDDTVSGLYSGEKNKAYTKNDLNAEFLRLLKLNSKRILSQKGTKNGIESLLSLFGYKINEDYTLKEYDVIVSQKNENICSTGESLNVETFNTLKLSHPTDTSDDEDISLEGLPIKIKYKGENKYIIPWLDEDEKTDGNIYFQMNGGWCKIDGTYKETYKYLGYVEEITDLRKISYDDLYNGIIYYVNNDYEISDYPLLSGLTKSQYFILENKENHYIIGENEEYTGWIPISSENEKVKYLESIVDDYRGNNPHVGFSHYDEGKEYFEYFNQLFKYSIENDNFSDEAYSCSAGTLNEEILNCGFDNIVSGETILYKEDNQKCWYFGNLEKEVWDESNSGESFYQKDFNPNDMSNLPNENDSASTLNKADSVMNTKLFDINFICSVNLDDFSENYKIFIKESVIPYVLQIIPSTTILRIKIN